MVAARIPFAVKDFHSGNGYEYITYDEDRCRVWLCDLPRNLACPTNAAISTIRCQPQFR